MKTRFWEAKTHFVSAPEVSRRFRADSVLVGSSPRADIHLPAPAPREVCRIERLGSGRNYKLEVLAENLEFKDGGSWKIAKSGDFEKLPLLRFKESVFEVIDLSDERKPSLIEPEEWVAKASKHLQDARAIWHFKNGVLLDSVVITSKSPRAKMKAGFALEWTPALGEKMNLIEFDGLVRGLELEQGRGEDSFRARLDDNIFVLTKVPESARITDLPVGNLPPPEKDYFKKTALALGATWILFISLMQLVPPTPLDQPVAIEELPADIAKIILESPKDPPSGGDGREGGGGVETVATKDKNGGSGFENQKISESAGPDEVVVKDKGALAALDKAEKVLGVGVLKAIEAGGALATALSALDEGVKSGKVKTAGIPSTNTKARTSGVGAVGGVLGALNNTGGRGPASGGVGIGGVGTQGYGGGGGGGKGNGFGTGIGDGLGKGNGPRTVAFENENLSVRGGLERSEVEAVIQENLSQIRYCYNKALRTNPNLQGKVTSAFTIGADGTVKTSRVAASTLASAEVEDCIKGRVASWRFPQPRGGGEVAVNYPFLLKSN